MKKAVSICVILGILLLGIIMSTKLLFDSSSDDTVIKTFQANKQDFVDSKDFLLNNAAIDEIYSDSYDKKYKFLVRIFDGLNYRGIHKADESYVYFVRVSEFGFTQGIVFSKTGSEPSSTYITELIKIEDGWYLFKTK